MKLSTIIIRWIILPPLALTVLSACTTEVNTPSPAPAETMPPTDSIVSPTATTSSAPTASVSAEPAPASATLDVSGLAQGVSSQVVEAVPASPDRPWWEAMPQHTRLTLEGYPIAGHLLQPQILIFPVDGLSGNEVAGEVADTLATLLENQQAGENLPYLPLYNATQVMTAQMERLGFKNGQGVRFLTQFDQAPLPINNHELLYTFQGLTSDGKYYVAAVLPVNLAALPVDEVVPQEQFEDFISSFPAYLADTVEMLDQQPASAFTPDLSALDSMIQSLEVQ